MRLAVFLLIILALPGSGAMHSGGANPAVPTAYSPTRVQPATSNAPTNIFDLTSFGAVGDGLADNGPALQNALDAIANAGGGTLFVPAGRYAIDTPVHKDFTGSATSLTIVGVESLVPVPPPNASGNELTQGLGLVSEFAPRTGEFQNALSISGLENLLIQDIVFIGTPDVENDALITLALADIESATVRHCEFYGLSSLVQGGAIVQATRSNFTFEQSVVLGSACSSGVYASIIQNNQWKGITISDSVFADYGQRPELFGKMNTAPFSWISIGNAAPPDNESPRREVVVRKVFLDEGGFMGLTSVPDLAALPVYPIDLLQVTGLHMNVSNLGTTGHYLDGMDHVLIEKSHYGWSLNSDSAINLMGIGTAIIDEVECVDGANRIIADSATGKLSVINSIYTHLDSQAQVTDVITTATPEEDPVQHVRQQFMTLLGREPDAAAHFYWSDQILQCGANMVCADERRGALAAYLGSAPAQKFAITGQVVTQSGSGMGGVTITLSGDQNVSTTTDSAGQYHFSNLPTSGVYTVTPVLDHHTITPTSQTITTPAGDQTVNAVALFNLHEISGRVTDAGEGIAGVTVTLSGTQSATVTTGADGNYSFLNLPANGDYTVIPQKTSYAFSPTGQTFSNLDADQNLEFEATLVTYSIAGILADANGNRLPGLTVILSGAQSGTTTTDNAGIFLFKGLPSELDYTVTPSVFAHTFNPPFKTFIGLSANQNHTYQANFTTHTVSGRATDATSGAPLSGATVTFAGETNGTTTTDANGNYSLTLPHGGSFLVSIAKPHYTFTQSSYSFANLSANQTGNFTATLNRHTIAGRATATNGSGLAGVTVTLSGSQTSTATTDATGAYSFANLAGGGNYTINLSKTSYSWAPPSSIFNDLGANQTANFTGTFVTYTLSGRVTENGVGLSGASIALSGSQAGTATTDAGGNYSFTVPSEGNYTLTPSKQHYTFPPAQTFNNLAANQVVNFVATRNVVTIGGRIININGTGVPAVTVSLSGFQTATTSTNSNGDYAFTNVPAGGDYSVVPTLQYHSFAPANYAYTSVITNQTNSFTVSVNTHSITGRVTSPAGVPVAAVTVALSGSLGPITSTTTGSDGNYAFNSLPAGSPYVVSVSKPAHVFSPTTRTFGPLNANQVADFTGTARQIEFNTASYTVSEGTGTVSLVVNRSGDTSEEATVTYSAINGNGTQGKDVGTVIGLLSFAPGESSKTITIFITDDAYVEGVEQLTVSLTNPQGGTLGTLGSTTLVINDNDSAPTNVNPVDDAQFFVRQHYRDFLNREPDAAGLAFWSNQILSCGADAACVENRRINVSAAFFLSIEFQETGFLVHRVYKASFAQPPQFVNQFLLDARSISQGLVVDAPGWQQLLENNKTNFLKKFVERSEFKTQYPLTLTPTEFVSLLNVKAGNPLSAEGTSAAIGEFNGAATSADTAARARVLRLTAESATFTQREVSPAFVLMQYFGYLQRNPSDPPDSTLEGYNFWLSKLNEFGGDFHRAQMVKSFLVAGEYRSRFGQ